MKKTKNYAMPYPEQDDYFNVEDFQDMMVSVDDLMKKLSDSGAQISSDAEHLYNQTKAQMDNIQKRMNAFTALKEGSTTGDAELTDIRVAYDGKEYGNAGEAVREQASDIHKALFGAGASIWSKAKSESTKYVAETKGICILNERFTAAGVVAKISRGTFAQNESTLNLDRECSAYIVEFEKNPGTVYMPSAETIKIVSTTKIIFEANGNARCWIPVEKGQYLAVDSTATAYTCENNHVPYMLYDQANKTLECRGFGSTGSIEPVDPYSLALEYKLEYDMDDTGLVKQIDANREAADSLKEILDDLIHVEKSKNLLDVSKMRNGFLQNNGVVSSDTWALDYYYTDIIPCNKISIVFANGTSNVQNQLGGLYKNGKWIAQLSQNAKISKIEDTKEHLFYFKIEFLNECPDFDGIILNTIHLDNFPKKFVMLDCEEPYIYSQYVDFYVEKSMSKNIPAQSITKQLESELIEKTTNRKSYIVNCWGDSLTRGVGGGDYNSKTYPAYLQNLLGREYVVNNLGVGGEPSETIGFREGGITGYIQPCTIPESGSVDIEIKSASGNNLYPMAQSPNDATGGGVNPVSICEIEGNLSYDNSKRTVVFTRKNNGGELKINKSTPIVTNGMSKFSDGVKIIWAGTNNKIKVVASNWNMGTLSYYLNGATDYIDSVLRDIDNIIGDSKSYIVIGMTSKTYMPDVVHINKVMAHKYGRHFLDVRELLLTSGLEDAGITPTEQDGADISNNEIPTSLRSDDTHLNAKGYANIAKYVYEKGQYLKYWN